ncbi:MAG: PIN domain nuclease [Actinomycetota bacterium]
MILVDTSAWIEFLRGNDSATADEVDRLLAHEIAICDAVSMEVLAGARDDVHLRSLRGLLARATRLPTFASDYDDAAGLSRPCRRSGVTVRRMIDCLIGAVAIRAGVPVLHADADFDHLAEATDLRTHPVP